MLLAIVVNLVATFAASTTGATAVLDFNLKGTPIQIVNNDDVEVKGTLKVFESHTTPLLLDRSLCRKSGADWKICCRSVVR